jgi:peptidoglycan/LPS O-acetylase OafA/YrhL
VQFYLALSMLARRATGDDVGVTSIFVLSAILGIVAQVPVTAWSQRHWTPPRAVVVGLLVIGAAFVLAGTSTAPPGSTDRFLQLAPVIAATAVLTLGTLIVQPFALDLTGSLGNSQRLIGTYFAFYYLSLGRRCGGKRAGRLESVWLSARRSASRRCRGPCSC